MNRLDPRQWLATLILIAALSFGVGSFVRNRASTVTGPLQMNASSDSSLVAPARPPIQPEAQVAPPVEQPASTSAPEQQPNSTPQTPLEPTSTGRTTKQLPSPGEIDLNQAGEDDLCRLPGVGPSTAEKIIQFRSQYGPFLKVDSLLHVPGIGPKRFAKIQPYVHV